MRSLWTQLGLDYRAITEALQIASVSNDLAWSGRHARTLRTIAVLCDMPPLLRELWREQHPSGHEQVARDLTEQTKAAETVDLFDSEALG